MLSEVTLSQNRIFKALLHQPLRKSTNMRFKQKIDHEEPEAYEEDACGTAVLDGEVWVKGFVVPVIGVVRHTFPHFGDQMVVVDQLPVRKHPKPETEHEKWSILHHL